MSDASSIATGDLARVTARLRAAGIVFAEDEAVLLAATTDDPGDREAMIVRRERGEPLETVVGWAEFCGRRIIVAPGVFVPRRRSELLARRTLAVTAPGAVVVELCCGVGAIATVLAAALSPLDLYAIDIEPAAVRCARANLGSRGRVLEGDLFAPLPSDLSGRVDVIVANAPYVPSAEVALLPREARLHEPLVTLDGGGDGLDVQRRIAAGALAWLAPGGTLLIETSAHQLSGSLQLMTTAGLVTTSATDDELDATVVIGTRPTTQ